ncbi:hypothetical protein DFQ01_14514 [Paenibacillus cellulosilyticus]|uniref:Uncharacterized protein n=1 Tax=Paenibacillus cellulosilyticus TaxID=375489 RepID=A0A2V2YD69_9BACL|nr:hypothetical protein DFQ01_14514 [Paenibacillus cellulosilyticus]
MNKLRNYSSKYTTATSEEARLPFFIRLKGWADNGIITENSCMEARMYRSLLCFFIALIVLPPRYVYAVPDYVKFGEIAMRDTKTLPKCDHC